MSALGQWIRLRTADGVVLRGPHEHVHMRRRPGVPTLRTVLADVVARRPADVGAPTQISVSAIVTHEGEHAAIAVVRFTPVGAAAIERYVAVVAGDDASIQFEGGADAAGDREFARLFERLVLCSRTGAATNRRRPFVYRPPQGWRGLRRSFSTLWFAPDYPRDPASIVIHDAIPIGARRDDLVGSFDVAAGTSVTRGAITGLWGATGAVLSDARFRYEIELDDPREAHRLILGGIVHSIEAVPAPAAALAVPDIDNFGSTS